MKSAQNQAGKATNNAIDTGQNLGQQAAGVNATLDPFLTQELQHPQGFSQPDQSAMLAAALGGAGGATSGITGQANLEAARSGNSGGFQAALDDAARSRTKAAAGASEGIAADNAQLKQTQQQDAARGLQSTYGTEQSGMLSAMGQVPDDINANVNAGKSGWLQNTMGILSTLNGGATAAGSLGYKPFGG
jgi:hypothetical protein